MISHDNIRNCHWNKTKYSILSFRNSIPPGLVYVDKIIFCINFYTIFNNRIPFNYSGFTSIQMPSWTSKSILLGKKLSGCFVLALIDNRYLLRIIAIDSFTWSIPNRCPRQIRGPASVSSVSHGYQANYQ